jgi:AAA family ATP:ADP antiporter
VKTDRDAESPSPLDHLLGIFGDVRPGESVTALLLLVNIFLLLVGYYVVKTVREPLILQGGGAELKSYASAGQALSLMVFIPLYSWLSSRVDRMRLITTVCVFFIACLELFYLGAQLAVPNLGIAFYIWVGIFSLATIAQFWSYANDLYPQEAGERLFPIIAIGFTAGPPIGSKIAELLFEAKIDPFNMLQITVVILAVQLALYIVVDRREGKRRGAAAPKPAALAGGDAFALIFRSPYLRAVGLMLVILNVVNTTGEYIVSRTVVEEAAARAALDPNFATGAFIGSFYGGYFFYVNVITMLVQAFLVSRLVKFAGLPGVILALPLVALGTYTVVAAGAMFAAIRWAKTAENSTDYSIMNTGRQMMWLPTTREEKYKAKQALDTFFVRTGDLLSAGLVFAGTHWLSLSVRGFAGVNLVLVLLWLAVAVVMLRRNRELTEQGQRAA